MTAEKHTPIVIEDSSSNLSLWDKTRIVVGVGYDAFVEALPKELEKTEGGKTLIDAAKKTKKTVGSSYDFVVEASGKIVDNISGAEAAAQIEELIAGQRRYNDILATRLAEALDRIEVLETEVKRLSDER